MFSICSYENVDIPHKSVIYCDIPYRSTNTGGYNIIDYDKFYDWCCEQTNQIFISEYWMPEDRFEVCKTFEIRQLSTRNGASKKVEERLYVPKH